MANVLMAPAAGLVLADARVLPAVVVFLLVVNGVSAILLRRRRARRGLDGAPGRRSATLAGPRPEDGEADVPPKTVAGLQRELGPRACCWEEEIPDIDIVLTGAVVFRPLPGGRIESYSRERREPVYRRQFADEAAAVAVEWQRLLQADDEPTEPRSPGTTTPATVEELKQALAQVGQDPDDVTRDEVLRESPKTEPVAVLRTLPDGTAQTFFPERGRESRFTLYATEAAAVAELAESMLLPYVGARVTDRRMERMQVHLRQYLALWAAHRAEG